MYPSIWQILIILLVVLILFGHKKIREFGRALGEGLRDFKRGLEGKSNSLEDKKDTDSNVQNKDIDSNSS